MTQQEHLQLIRAKCVELLELAKQRTPGRWRHSTEAEILYGPEYGIAWEIEAPDGTFIASTAGSFEAALASTIAAIDGIIDPESSQTTHSWSLMHERFTVKQIIASWPLELLQQ